MSTSFPENDYGDFVGTFDFRAPEVKAPIWPLVVSAVFLVLSFALIVLERSSEGTTLLAIAFVGYVLTPLGTAAMLILAMRSHKNLSSTAGYRDASGKTQIKFCSLIAWAGFIAAIPHIWFIADHFALLFAPGPGA